MQKKPIWNNSSIIRTQGNIDPVYFTLAPKNYATFAQVEQWFHCAIYFGAICHRYQRLRLLYGFATMWLAYIHRSVRLPVQDIGIVGQFELDNPVHWHQVSNLSQQTAIFSLK